MNWFKESTQRTTCKINSVFEKGENMTKYPKQHEWEEMWKSVGTTGKVLKKHNAINVKKIKTRKATFTTRIRKSTDPQQERKQTLQ